MDLKIVTIVQMKVKLDVPEDFTVHHWVGKG